MRRRSAAFQMAVVNPASTFECTTSGRNVSSTLPMSGNDDKSGMVNPDLQVWGKKGLYVCDNSVFPTSPAANPSLTLAALALRLAEHLCA